MGVCMGVWWRGGGCWGGWDSPRLHASSYEIGTCFDLPMPMLSRRPNTRRLVQQHTRLRSQVGVYSFQAMNLPGSLWQ